LSIVFVFFLEKERATRLVKDTRKDRRICEFRDLFSFLSSYKYWKHYIQEEKSGQRRTHL